MKKKQNAFAGVTACACNSALWRQSFGKTQVDHRTEGTEDGEEGDIPSKSRWIMWSTVFQH